MIASILDFVGDDKSTLARCMRVFQQLNALAAPRLYRDIRWGSHVPSPFAHSPPIDSGLRISPTKRDSLVHIRTLRVDNHSIADCNSESQHAFEEQMEDLLHVDVLIHEAIEDYGDATCYRIFSFDTPGALLSHIGPKKLVLNATYTDSFPEPIRPIDQQDLEKIVTWVNWCPSNRYPKPQHVRPFVSSRAASRTIVYLIGFPRDSSSFTDAPVGFHQRITNMVYSSGFASEIIFVNAHISQCREAREVFNKRFATMGTEIETVVAAELGMNTSSASTATETDSGDKSKRQPQMPIVKCIGMREYLDNYETAGEFTDEERKRYHSLGDCWSS
jgi:hypothetical protein